MVATYRFGQFRLDAEGKTLFSDSEPVPLGRRAVALLRALTERPGMPVAKDALMHAAWPGLAVEESNLTVQIAALRRALSREPGGDRWIETLPRRGYRFVGPVSVEYDVDVTGPSPESRSIAPLTKEAKSERRQLTIAACELMFASANLDVEDLRDIIEAYRRRVAETCSTRHGVVDMHTGNTVIVHFGWPVAREDDAEGAVHAALELCANISRLPSASRFGAHCRVGIATGVAIVGEPIPGADKRDSRIVGEAATLAGRLLARAEPGAVLIDHTTHRLIGDFFTYRDLGLVADATAEAAVHAWRVLSASTIDDRFEALRGTTVKKGLVGRAEELDVLNRRWAQARSGEGCVVLIAGEPGIGKSRLTLELQQKLQAEPHATLRFFCSPHHVSSPLYPVISQLERTLQLAATETAEQKRIKLSTHLAKSARSVPHSAVVWGELLGLPADPEHPPPQMSAQQRKETAFAGFLYLINGLCAQQPVLLICEDAHWLDPTSLELLTILVERTPSLPLLVIVTFRPEFAPPWLGPLHVTMTLVSRLSPKYSADLAQQVAGETLLGPDLVEQITSRADGIPLFVEELTRTVMEKAADTNSIPGKGAGPSTIGVPSSLHASLLARLDNVGPAKEIAQIGAVIGREFAYELLPALGNLADRDLQSALDRLTEAGLVFSSGVPPHAKYVFKHALVQDAAYGMLLRGRRQQLHAKIAELFEASQDGPAETQPELLGHHFSEANIPQRAVTYWLAAGRIAAARSANIEAAIHARRGLAELQLLPHDDQRDVMELDLRIVLGSALTAVKGYSVEETVSTWEKARGLISLARESAIGDAVLSGLYSAYYNRGAHRNALQVGDELLARAEKARNAQSMCAAHRQVGATLAVLGEFRASNDHCRKGFELFDPDAHGKADYRFVNDVGVAAACQWAIPLWHLGKIDKSLELERWALARMVGLQHANTIAYGTFYAGALSAMRRRDFEALQRYAVELQRLGSSHKLPQWLAFGSALEGPALAHAGHIDDALEKIENAINVCEEIQNKVMRPVFLSGLAEVQTMAGRYSQAEQTLDAAIQAAEQTEERWANPELWRLRGSLVLAARGAAAACEAAEHFRRAIAIAGQQESRMLGLRVATNLARLLTDQDRIQEAREMLTSALKPICGGAATPDPKEAHDLLRTLTAC
jgi:DNA-binding winged helix-turn-helix (wHTH) protein/predicted ATPase